MEGSWANSDRLEMLEFVPPDARRVLEIGCHAGGFARALKLQRSVEIWGVEPSEMAASQAFRNLDKLVVGSFDKTAPVPSAYFDAVIFNDSLEHMADPWEALRLAAAKLRADGCVVASIPNFRQIDNLIHVILDADFQYEAEGVRDRTHLRFFTRKSITRLFADSGFRVGLLKGINETWWSPSLLRRAAFRFLSPWLEDTKYLQYAVVAYPNAIILDGR